MTLRWIQRALCAIGMLMIAWSAAAADTVTIQYAWVDKAKTVALMAVRVNDREPVFGFVGAAPADGKQAAVQFEIRTLKTSLRNIDPPTLLKNLRDNTASALYTASLNDLADAQLALTKPPVAALKSLHDALQSSDRPSSAASGGAQLAAWTWSSDTGGPLHVALADGFAFVQRGGSRSDGAAERIEAALVAFVEKWQVPRELKPDSCSALAIEARRAAGLTLFSETGINARVAFASHSTSLPPAVNALGNVVTVTNERLVTVRLMPAFDPRVQTSGVELLWGSERKLVTPEAPIEVPACDMTQIVARAATDQWSARLMEMKEGKLEAEVDGQMLRIYRVPPVGVAWTAVALLTVIVVALAGAGGLLWTYFRSRSHGVRIKVERPTDPCRKGLWGTPTPRAGESGKWQPESGGRGSSQEKVVRQRNAKDTDSRNVPSVASPLSVAGNPVQTFIDSLNAVLPTLQQLSRDPNLLDTTKKLARLETAFKDWSPATPGEVAEALRDVLRVEKNIRESAFSNTAAGSPQPPSPNMIIEQSSLGVGGATERIRRVIQTLNDLADLKEQAHKNADCVTQQFDTFTSNLSKELQESRQPKLATDVLISDVAALRRLAETLIAAYTPPKAGADPVLSGSRVLQHLEQQWQRVRGIPDRVRAYESDPRIHLALVALDMLDAAGRALPAVASSARADLLAGADLDLDKLSGRLSSVAASTKEQLRGDFNEKAAARAAANEPERREDIDACLLAVFKRLLRGGDASELTRMLRLWQVMETYWRHSKDPDAISADRSGNKYREHCEFFQSVVAQLGVRFHPIQFLQRLPSTADGSSPWHWELQKTAAPLRESRSAEWQRQNVSFYDGTIADVTQWGVDCKFAPELSSKSNIFLWNV